MSIISKSLLHRIRHKKRKRKGDYTPWRKASAKVIDIILAPSTGMEGAVVESRDEGGYMH